MMEGATNPRRRRGAGVVTSNACTECRKKRSKCDGQTPCQRCVTQNTECVYEVPVRHSKDMMRSEIEQLQTHRRQSERILSAIVSTTESVETLNRLKNGESVEAVAEWLDRNALTRMAGGVTTYASTTSETTIKGILRVAEKATDPIRTTFGGTTLTPSDQQSPVSGQWLSTQSQRHTSYSFETGASQGEDAMNWMPDQNERGESLDLSRPLIGSWPDAPSTDDLSDTFTHASRGRGQDQILGSSYAEQESPNNKLEVIQSWTVVTSSPWVVSHILALYFCWEYPTFASLSKEHFLTDFRAGRPRYCSSILVNAMLALGCRFSSLAEARADPNDPETSGDHFFAECKRLLAEDDRTSLTTIQALGLIAIREASCGRESESFYYGGQAIRLAVEFGLHIEVTDKRRDHDNAEHDVRAATFWGAFALDQSFWNISALSSILSRNLLEAAGSSFNQYLETSSGVSADDTVRQTFCTSSGCESAFTNDIRAWCLSIGKIPHFSRSVKLVSKPAIVEAVEISLWVPYTDDGVPEMKYANQPSNVRSVYKAFCELSELVHRSLYTLYTPGRNLTSMEILAVYTRYLNWYSSLPEVLRLGHNFTPAVLFAHMFYHYSILMLFRPFIKFRFAGSAVFPRDVCSQAADALTALVRSYDQLYTLQRTPSFVPFIVLASSIMHLIEGKETSDTRQLRQGARDLKDMSHSHGFSGRALNIIRFLAYSWDLEDFLGGQDLRSPEELARNIGPLTTSLNLFCPDPGALLPDIDLKNDAKVFNPFPLQGQPLLSSGAQLERDGFIRAPMRKRRNDSL